MVVTRVATTRASRAGHGQRVTLGQDAINSATAHEMEMEMRLRVQVRARGACLVSAALAAMLHQ